MTTSNTEHSYDYFRIYNFGAGPSALPLEVLLQVKEDLPSWHGKGYSVLEMGHRSSDFQKICTETSNLLKELYGIGEDYDVLFMQGGGHLQFAMVPLNLRTFGQGNYCVNGVWSRKAFAEAVRIGQAAEAVRVENRAPRQDEIKQTEDAGFLYYCSNETVNGIRYWYVPQTSDLLVSDMSSDFLSQKVDVSKFAIIFAGAQKNFGPAGLTVAIIRKDIVGRCPPTVPSMLDYKTYLNSGSLYNTPPTFAIYVADLVCRWLIKEGGLEEMEKRSLIKSGMLYDVIDNSRGFYNNK
ncbi:MAG: 3-phosphoserine/phosphohydroxythreonine transaminase, partial [Burkholderiales bacterium]|nr:3-phosphoserine/phosphohydroxythreonine transaminase [Burkholderiales bacterium]